MRNKFGIAFMVFGAALLITALSLLIWNRQEDEKAGQSVDLILPKIVEQANAKNEENPPQQPDLNETDMKTVQIDGYDYVGYLTIPALNLELPVMNEWDYKRLKISPCRYSGSVKTGDMVIAAHNYKKHFGRLLKLSQGDEIYFTDMDGKKYSYSVQTVESLTPTAIEEMTSGEYELTLFTCTYGGKSRITVRCSADNTNSQ